MLAASRLGLLVEEWHVEGNVPTPRSPTASASGPDAAPVCGCTGLDYRSNGNVNSKVLAFGMFGGLCRAERVAPVTSVESWRGRQSLGTIWRP